MKEVYNIFNDNTHNHVATIIYDRETKEYTSELIIGDEAPILWAELNKGIHWGKCTNPEPKYMEAWLKDRVIPENRDMLKDILIKNGVYEYNWRELIKLNHGRTVSDYYSVDVEERE